MIFILRLEMWKLIRKRVLIFWVSIWIINLLFPSTFLTSAQGYTIKYKSLKDLDIFYVAQLKHGFTRLLLCHIFNTVVPSGIFVVLGIQKN